MIGAGALASLGGVGRLYADAGETAPAGLIPGDGKTPVAGPLQSWLYRLAQRGGGIAVLPPGRYLLEKTLLLPSRVHLVGHGAGTILTGHRPAGVNGYALVANDGIVTARGYDGARFFSMQNLAIDSPRTNGIVLVHASDGYFSHIYGLDAYHHHFDIAGSRNIVTENLFLTGRSGTAPYQVDGSPYNNNIWDGETNVAPIRDDTPNDGILLSDSVIRPTNRPDHGFHLHRRGGRNIFVDNVVIENVENGVYRDRNCSREDVFFSNMAIRNVSQRAVRFEPSGQNDQRITFDNMTVSGCADPVAFEYRAGEELTLNNVKVESESTGGQVLIGKVAGGSLSGLVCRGEGTGPAIRLLRCRNLFLSRISVRAFPIALELEDCANVQYSGLMASDKDGNPVSPEISGRGFLTTWASS